MNFFSPWFNRSVIVASIFTATLSSLPAQELEHLRGGQDAAIAAPASTRLIAKLTPVDAKSQVEGRISFGLVGDVLMVSGGIEGLGPNKRYRLDVALDEKSTPSKKGVVEMTIPVTSIPAAADGDLEILVADSNGKIEIKTALKGIDLTKGDRAILGKALILTEIPGKEAAGEALKVASAVIKRPESRTSPVRASRLDELGPDERWF